MAIYSSGYVPGSSLDESSEFDVFLSHLELILNNSANILKRSEYFFCPLSFAWCSWPYFSGDGPLWLGFLLLGWQDGILTEHCVDCNSTVLVTSFGGSPLSGTNSYSGICTTCLSRKYGRGATQKPLSERIAFIAGLRKAFPTEVSEWQEYDGFIFSWGGNGLAPARKKRLVTHKLVEPVSLPVLLDELVSGELRRCPPPNVSLLRQDLKFKFSSRPASPRD